MTTPKPAMRDITVMAQDPSVRVNGRILMARICIPAEDLIAGPTGYRVQVVDYDSSTGSFHGAHTVPPAISKEPPRWQAGDPRIVDDYVFHAQNVYALVMKTLWRFEFALGRRIGWSFKTHQLKVAPHGMVDANAFYSPHEEGLVFGYFPGRKKGETIFTCLSHDIVVHETAHALIDALRERYMDPSSPDQAAFHEGLADVIALLSVFSQREVLLQLLREHRTVATTSPAVIGRKDVQVDSLRESALFGLAEEMGSELQTARGDALRQSARIKPAPGLLAQPEFQEAHRRGEILVAAVLHAFVAAWAARVEGIGPGQPEYPLLRVAEEGADIADALATLWIRAIDYMPPVHLEFPDALTAALTADLRVRPDDQRFELRRHTRQSFAAFGIQPRTRRADGSWDEIDEPLDYDRVRFESMRSDEDEVFRFLWENREALGVHTGIYTKVLSVRPCTRIGPDGFTLRETVAEYYQVARLTPPEIRRNRIRLPPEYVKELRKERQAADVRRRSGRKVSSNDDAAAAENPEMDLADQEQVTPLYGGGVLIFDEYGRLKYHVHNDVLGPRQAGRLAYLWDAGQLEAGRKGAQLRAARLSTIHRMRGIDARRFPAEGW
jgi:hypothetical protein